MAATIFAINVIQGYSSNLKYLTSRANMLTE